jgi:HAD superfamily hydrolase (TIGR01509 family)
LKVAVVSSSANTEAVLQQTGLDRFVELRVDGVSAVADGLVGKPAPDTFLAAARGFGVPPSEAAVFEDAIAGVQAGRAGAFGWVVGVDRADHADALAEHADVVVAGLGELLDR